MRRSLPARAARALILSVLAVAGLAAAATAAPAPAASRNLLANPGFEAPREGHPWMPAAWDTAQTGVSAVFFGRDTFLVHGGSYAVSVANTSTLIPVWPHWLQTVLVGREAWGKDLVFSVWTRSNGVQGRAYAMVQVYRDTVGKMAKTWGIERDAAGKRLSINKVDDPLVDLGWKREYFSEEQTDWVRRELRVFVPPSSDVVYIRLGLFGTGQVIFDDASLTLEPARPAPPVRVGENLLADPGFEGDGNAWEYSLPPYPGSRIDRDTTIFHGGHASVRYASGDGLVKSRSGACQALANRNLAGKRLRLSGWVRTDSLKELAYIKLYCHTISLGMVQCEPSLAYSMNTDWTKVTVEMDAPPDTYEVWAWFAFNAPATGNVWYDDTSLEVIGDAKPPARPAARRASAPPARKAPAAARKP